MREPRCCSRVRFYLDRHGLPSARTERIVGELRDHWEDLRFEAVSKGCSESSAAAQADARLGDPLQIAETIIAGLRRSSWLGRHPFVTVGVLPFFLTPILMSVLIFPLWGLDALIHFSDKGNVQAVRNSQIIAGVLWTTYGLALAAAPIWLCRQIWRAGLGRRWILAACAWCALFALARFFDADPATRNISSGFVFPWRLNMTTAMILIFHTAIAMAFLHSWARLAVSQLISSPKQESSLHL